MWVKNIYVKIIIKNIIINEQIASPISTNELFWLRIKVMMIIKELSKVFWITCLKWFLQSKRKLKIISKKIYLQYSYNKNRNIKASFNIRMFCYLRHKIGKYVLKLMVIHVLEINANNILVSKCTEVFTKTLCLSCKHNR